jgi:putative heme-binding domain-containing protein
LSVASDADPRVQFQAALTLGDLKDPKSLGTLVQLAHERSGNEWFRLAILSSVADTAAPFYQAVVAKGESWTDPQMLTQLSALIGARQNPAELSRWFAVLPKLSHPESALDGLNRGLKLSNARHLQVPGAEQIVSRLIKSGSEPAETSARDCIRYFDFQTLVRSAMKDALDTSLPGYKRIGAARALQGGRFNTVAPVLDQILQRLSLPDLESAAIDSLATFEEPASGQIILKHWATLTADGRNHALDALVTHENRVPLLLKAIDNGQVKPTDIDPSVRSHLYENPNPEVVKKAHALLSSATTDRRKIVASYHDALTMQGNTQKGKILFSANCGRCHTPQEKGGRVGPDLSGINNKTKEELLTDILDPNYAIEPRFVNYVLTTKAGYIYDGVISNETPGLISLRGGSADRNHTVLRTNMAGIHPSRISLMPEGFEQKLTTQDIADIVAYLRGGL